MYHGKKDGNRHAGQGVRSFTDSSLIIFQTRGEFKTKDPKLMPYHQYLAEMIQEFKEVSFSYVSRTQN